MKKLYIARILLVLFSVLGGYSAFAASPDSVITQFLTGYPNVGGSSAAPNNDPSDYPNGVTKCSSSAAPTHEVNCPSDLLYTPNANTGGYQSFGIGLKNYPANTYYYGLCSIAWDYDIDYGWYPYFICYYYTLEVVDHTFGTSVARVAFGGNTTSTTWGSKPMSTLAFKANVTYNSPLDSSVICDTDWNYGYATPCDPSDDNVYAVENAGYEDKIIITDKACDVPWSTDREGDDTDAEGNCFTHYGQNWITNLPSPYPDTTWLDEEETYQPAMGSADPENIVEGYVYTWAMDFYQLGLETGSPSSPTWELRHNAAVTTYWDLLWNCSSSALWNCYFNVDQTKLTEVVTWP